jgi:4-amino-4-deoxy-L-arabinose transferase-like glycosyltransferase
MSEPAARGRQLVRTALAVLVVSALLGLIDAWAYRFSMNPDGVCYLDLGDDLARGDFRQFVNAHWSPLYPALLSAALHLTGTPAEEESQTAHAVNFVLYLYAVAGAGALVRELLVLRRRQTAGDGADAEVRQGRLLVWTFFLLFWAVALRFVGLAFVTPDMLLFGTALLCLALVLRARRASGSGLGWCLLLGLCAGVGYLVRAPLLLLAPILVLGAALAPNAPSWRVAVLRAAVATASFLVLAGPWVTCLSHKYGHLTFSDSGPLNRLWEVSHSAPHVHWQGDRPDTGTPEHPTRVVLRSPTVYEFGEPVRATYPPWKDPGYWMAGARPTLDLAGHLRRLGESVGRLGSEMWEGGHVLLAAVLLIALLVRWGRQGAGALWRAVRPAWPMLLFGAAGLLMFALVLTEKRYVASFWLALFAGPLWVLAPVTRSARPYRLLVLAAVVPFVTAVVPPTTMAVWLLTRGPDVAPTPRDLPPAYHQRAAAELRRLGVEPGTPVAVIGGPAFDEYWARLCRARIVAEVPASEDALLRDPESFRRVLTACRAAGARFAVVNPQGAAPEGAGEQVPGTRLRVFDLRDDRP